jgi:Amt family ammonium transporter
MSEYEIRFNSSAASSASFEDVLSPAWLLLCGSLVTAMQLGFALLEVGSVRDAHRMTVLIKNVMDSCVSCIFFNFFCGVAKPTLIVDSEGETRYHFLFFHWAFCATSVTICSGSMAERTHMIAYLSYAALMAGIVYPIAAESAWGQNGLLHWFFHRPGLYAYHDFAGSGIVHVLGGSSALMGNLLLGRRITNLGGDTKIDPSSGVEQSSPKNSMNSENLLLEVEEAALPKLEQKEEWRRRFDDAKLDAKEFTATGYMQVFGTFLLWVSWYGFNCGSVFAVNAVAMDVATRVAWNTTLAAAAGGCGAYVHCYCSGKHLDTTFLCNGVLGGLVAVTAGCDVGTPTLAITTGLSAGLVCFPLAKRLMILFKLDDPVDAIPVHAFCGLFGVLIVPFFRPDCAHYGSMPDLSDQQHFCSPDYSIGSQLIAQVLGVCTLAVWASSVSLVLWGIFAVCERTRALEVEYMTLADELLCQIEESDPATEDPGRWLEIVQQSPLARRIMQKHGWNASSGRFAPGDIWSVRKELHEVCENRAKSALESKVPILMQCCVQSLRFFKITRELTGGLRLRIPPSAELSGLGAASNEGIELVSHMRGLLAQAMAAHSPIKREVQDLSLTVRGQGVLINDLVRGRRTNTKSRSPQAPTHTNSATSKATLQPLEEAGASSSSTSMNPKSDGGSSPPRRLQPFAAQLQPLVEPSPRAMSETSSSRTQSFENISIGSGAGNDDTPPPSLIGRRFNASDPGMMASQLANMIQAHQQFILALEHAGLRDESSLDRVREESLSSGSHSERRLLRNAAGTEQAASATEQQRILESALLRCLQDNVQTRSIYNSSNSSKNDSSHDRTPRDRESPMRENL